MSALTALSEVVEPDVRVLVIGERQDADLYRATHPDAGRRRIPLQTAERRGGGATFGPFVMPAGAPTAQTLGGRILAVTGICGGAGATTLAANLAWYLATEAKRHTVLLDANLYTGTAAMLLAAKTGSRSATGLETPEQVDGLFMERIAQPATARLAVIAGEEKLTEPRYDCRWRRAKAAAGIAASL